MTGRRLPALLLCGFLACGSAVGQVAAPDPAAAAATTPAPTSTPAADGAAPTATPIAPPLRTAPVLPQPPQPAVAASAGSLVQTITGLLIVLGALALFAWGMKRFGPKAQAGAGGLRIVGGLNLGGRERIVLVEVGDQWIVVGASPGRVNALATMPKQEHVAAAHAGDTAIAPTSSFGEWLKQTVEKRNAK